MSAVTNCPLLCGCGEPVTVAKHVELGGGYGQRVSGLAFYYACDGCGEDWKVGDHTDMSRTILVRRAPPGMALGGIGVRREGGSMSVTPITLTPRCSVDGCNQPPFPYTTASRCERHDMMLRLSGWLHPGMTLYTVLKHVSRSGMSRSIAVVMVGEDGVPFDISGHIADTLDRRYDSKHGGVMIHGGGMDMGYEVVYQLSRTLYAEGFDCIGETCPANDHHNEPWPGKAAGSMRHHDGGFALSQRWLT